MAPGAGGEAYTVAVEWALLLFCVLVIGDLAIFMYASHSHWVGGGESSASSASSSCCLAWALDCFSLGSARFLCRGFLVVSVGAWVGRGGWCGNGREGSSGGPSPGGVVIFLLEFSGIIRLFLLNAGWLPICHLAPLSETVSLLSKANHSFPCNRVKLTDPCR